MYNIYDKHVANNHLLIMVKRFENFLGILPNSLNYWNIQNEKNHATYSDIVFPDRRTKTTNI